MVVLWVEGFVCKKGAIVNMVVYTQQKAAVIDCAQR